MTVIDKIDSDSEKKVEELRERFTDKMETSMFEDKFMFLRFLKARNCNVDQAEAMLKKHLEWRTEFKVDTISTQKIISEEIEKYVPHSLMGFDKELSPIKYLSLGKADAKGLQMAVKFIDRIRYFIKVFEEEMALVEQQSKKAGKKLDGNVYVVDMKDFSFATATDRAVIQDLIYLARMFQDNYPERLKAVLIINASSYFSILYSMIKNFLAADIINKIQILTNEEDSKNALLKYIDADVLPAFLGGKRTDPDGDPLCKTFLKHAAPVPAHLYNCKSKNSLSKNKEAKKLVIPRASFNEIELQVTEPDSVIEWEFEIKSRDVGFGLFLNETDSDGEEKITELVALLRLDTEEFSETGMFKCEKPGKYVILFDNSYSWVRSKEVYYKAKVITLKEHESAMTS